MQTARLGLPSAIARLCALAALPPLVAAVAHAAPKPEPVPDWFRAAAHQPLPPLPPEARAVILLDETTYTVAPDGQATEHHRHVSRILRPQGRSAATVEVEYDRDTKILSLHVWSIGPDGHEYALKDADIADHGFFGNTTMYVEDRVKEAHPLGADPGAYVAYEYEQKVRPYVSEATWFYQDDLPRLNQSFTLELPPGYTYNAVWAHQPSNATPLKPIDLEHQHYRWVLDNTPGIDLDRVPMHPYPPSLAGRMTLHYAAPARSVDTGTWKGIGQWYRTLEQDRLTPSPEVAAKAQQLVAGKSDFYDRTEAVSEFVQHQIRYFAVELGVGGYQPHPAADIFRNRYGDCKDKATLLTAMLSAVGVHAALVMVDTHRGVIDPDAPSIVGNHMIAAIEIPSGYTSPKLASVVTARTGRRYLIFDPTWEQTPFGQLESNLQGGYGVLMEDADSQILALPVLDPKLNTIQRQGSFQLAADGTLTGSVTEKQFGDLSEHRRRIAAESEAREGEEALDHALERDFTSFKVSNLKMENMESLHDEATVSYSLTAERFGKTMGPLLMVRPRILGLEDVAADQKPRKVPVNLHQTMQVRDDYQIALPPGYSVDETPEPVKLDMGFASYESASTVSDGKLHYTRTYTVRQVTLPPDKYPDFQRFVGTIQADEQRRAVFKKQP